MDFIWNQIAIGNRIEARNRELLQEHRIAAVLSLDGSLRGFRRTWRARLAGIGIGRWAG